MKKFVPGILVVLMLSFTATACGGDDSNSEKQYSSIASKARGHQTYIPRNGVELKNYEDAQKLYDDPSTIIWCTAFPTNSSAPVVTVPIAGKLTSSTTSWFSPQHIENNDSSGSGVAVPSRSVDGLYHPNPPPYRYGFTPGGQYIDFFNLETFCTTQPYRFDRQKILVKVDGGLNSADKKATEALKQGDKSKAQKILEAAAGQ